MTQPSPLVGILFGVMIDHLATKAHGRFAVLCRTSFVVLTLAVSPACTDSDDLNDLNGIGDGGSGGTSEPDSVLDRVEALGFGQFAALAKASSFADLLSGDDDVTVFAPTDQAFAALPASELLALFNPAALADLDAFVANHITMGALDTATLEGLDQLATVGMSDAFVDSLGSTIYINDAAITSGDDLADNGLLYGLSLPLEAPRSVLDTLDRRGFDTLVELVELAGLTGAINGGQFTILCPTEEAFDALPAGELDFLRDPANQGALQDRLELHMVNGASTASALVAMDVLEDLGGSFLFFEHSDTGVPSANGHAFTSINTRCSDGVLQTLDTVFAELPSVAEQASAEGLMTFMTLAFAGGLDSELGTLTPLTLFGPSDIAISQGLAPGIIDQLVDPANLPRLQRFVRSHSTLAPLGYRTLVPGTQLTALTGDMIDVTENVVNETTLNGTAAFTVRNVYARNGVLHVIDGVLNDGE